MCVCERERLRVSEQERESKQKRETDRQTEKKNETERVGNFNFSFVTVHNWWNSDSLFYLGNILSVVGGVIVSIHWNDVVWNCYSKENDIMYPSETRLTRDSPAKLLSVCHWTYFRRNGEQVKSFQHIPLQVTQLWSYTSAPLLQPSRFCWLTFKTGYRVRSC